MSSQQKVERLIRAEKLPPGHYERRNAQREVDKEYALCKEVEWKWMRKLEVRYFLSMQQAVNIAAELCRAIGTRPVRKMKKTDRPYEYYGYRCIYVDPRLPGVSIWTVVHETAHHVQIIENMSGSDHGHTFCWIEELLFEALSGVMRKVCPQPQ